MTMVKVLVGTLILGSTLLADPYASCVMCHGASGEKAALGGKSKVIKDMSKADIAASLKGYQDGTYGGGMKGAMAAPVKGLSAGDIEAIANKIGK